jgi:predicted kinase
MEKILFIVRGIPNSGKSTFAKQLTSNVFEADHYFYDENCNYNFDSSKIKDAHKNCQDNVRYAMESNVLKIAVANTFTQEWEISPYYELAEKYGYTVFSLIVENRHGKTNNHEVPHEKIELMKGRFEFKL